MALQAAAHRLLILFSNPPVSDSTTMIVRYSCPMQSAAASDASEGGGGHSPATAARSLSCMSVTACKVGRGPQQDQPVLAATQLCCILSAEHIKHTLCLQPKSSRRRVGGNSEGRRQEPSTHPSNELPQGAQQLLLVKRAAHFWLLHEV